MLLREPDSSNESGGLSHDHVWLPVLSLASFIASRGLLELKEGAAGAKGRHGLVGDAKGQASRGVYAGVAEVKSRAAAAAEAWKVKGRGDSDSKEGRYNPLSGKDGIFFNCTLAKKEKKKSCNPI